MSDEIAELHKLLEAYRRQSKSAPPAFSKAFAEAANDIQQIIAERQRATASTFMFEEP